MRNKEIFKTRMMNKKMMIGTLIARTATHIHTEKLVRNLLPSKIENKIVLNVFIIL